MDFVLQELNTRKPQTGSRPPQYPNNNITNHNKQLSNPRTFSHSPQQPKVFPPKQQNPNYRGQPSQRQPIEPQSQYSRPSTYNNNPRFPPSISNPNNYQHQNTNKFQPKSQPSYQRKPYQPRGNHQGYQGGRNNYNNDRDHQQHQNEDYDNRNDSRSPNNFNTRGNIRGRGRGGRGGRPYQQPQQNNYQQQLKQFVQQNFANNPYVRNMINQRGRGRGGKQPQTRYIQKPKYNKANDEQMKNRRQKFSSNYAKKPNQKSFQKDDEQSVSHQNRQNQQSQQQESYYSDQQNSQQLQEGASYQNDDADQQNQKHQKKRYNQKDSQSRSQQDQGQEEFDQDQGQGQEGSFQQQGSDQYKDSVNIQQDEKSKLNKVKSPQKMMKKLSQFNTTSSSRCIDEMCSKEQYEDRLQTFNSNNREADRNKLKLDTSRSFSVFQINKRTMKPDYTLTLKRFRRSADRAQEGVVQDTRDLRRSIKALNKVIIHIGKQILDADKMNKKDLAFPLPPGEDVFQFIHIYDFLWDRMREMIKDITRLSQKQQMTKEIITISQQIARFFILGINQGRKKYTSRLQFDQKMNRQSIVKILTILKQFYHNSRMELKKIILENNLSQQNSSPGQIQKLMKQHCIYISPNEPQIISYVFLFSNDRKKQFYEILSVGESSKNPLFQSQQIQKALQVHKFLNQKNYEQYFQYLQSESIDYAMSCLMLHHLNNVRKEAVKVIFKTQICQNSKNSVFTQELRQVLRFKDKQQKQFEVFLSFLDVQRKNGMLICNDPQFQDNVRVYKTPEYIFNINKLERKLFTTKNLSKPIISKNQISRQEIVTRSWKTSTYDKQIIAFYLGASYDPSLYVDAGNISQSHQRKQLQQDQEQDQEEPVIKKKIIRENKNSLGKSELNPSQISIFNKQQQKPTITQLEKTRQNLLINRKNKKRVEFLLKFQEQIKQLFRQTDKGKQLKQKKSIAVMDQWIMYYHDKMLKIALDKIHYEFRKKVLISAVFEEMLAFKEKRKNFFSKINRCPYEMDPEIYIQQWGVKQTRQQNEPQKIGIMSKKLKKMNAQIQIPIYLNFQQSLNSYKIQKVPNKVYNIFIMSAISSSNFQNTRILINLIKFFITKSQQLSKFDVSRAISMVERLNNDKKMAVIQQSFFIGDHKTQIKVKLVKIIDINNINGTNKNKKTNLNNSTNNMKKNEPLLGYYHLIPHFFGCHSAIVLRQNSKPQSINPILKIFEDFQNTNSRAQISDKREQSKLNIMYKKLKFNQLPLLMINIMKSSLEQNKIKPLPKSQELEIMTNLDQVTISDLIQEKDLSHFLRNSLRCSLQRSVYYDLNSPMHQFISQENSMVIKPLQFILKQIKVNAVNVQQKIRQYYRELPQNLQKVNTFVFYQQYFNMCIQQLLKSIFWCFDNCKYQSKWPTYLDHLQHRQQIQMDQQTSINLISQTYYEMEFQQSICQKLKMNFVGPDSQKLDKEYLFDNFNHHFQKKNNTSNSSAYNEKNDRKKMTSYEAMQNLVRFHQMLRMITDYINQFAAIKTTFNQQKTQALINIFGNHDLRIRVYESRRKLKINGVQQQQFEYLQNSHLMGNSLQLFNFITTCLMQNVSFINVIVPVNFRFSIDSEQFYRRVQLQIGKEIRRKNHPFGIIPGPSGKQNIIQKLVKTYNNTHEPIPLASRAGPYLPQIEYLQPQIKRNRNFPNEEDQQYQNKTQKRPSIQKIPFQKQLQKQSKSKQAFFNQKQIQKKKLHEMSYSVIDVDELERKQEQFKLQKQKSIQKLFNSYRDHHEYVSLHKVINKKGKNLNFCGTKYQNQQTNLFNTTSEKIESNYIRKGLMDTIRKKIKLNNI